MRGIRIEHSFYFFMYKDPKSKEKDFYFKTIFLLSSIYNFKKQK